MREVVLITSKATLQKDFSEDFVEQQNVSSLSWFTQCSKDPFLYLVALDKFGYTRKLIDKSGVFVINFVEEKFQNLSELGDYGHHSIDKVKWAGLATNEAKTVDCPVIQTSNYFECKVVDRFQTGDHEVFVGRVLYQG